MSVPASRWPDGRPYFRVSSERHTTENQFEDLLHVAEKDGSGRDGGRIREMLSRCVIEEHRPGTSATSRIVYRVDAQVAAELARECVYVEQAGPAKSVPASARCSS